MTADATTTDFGRTAQRAAQLVAASERLSFDPFRDIDWDVPLDDSQYHLPPEFLPLYGTGVWDAMPEEERRAYSRHEAAALCGAGIWFENLLIQAVMRHLTELPVTDPSHRYLLVEVADECRHSMMFGEYIRRAGTPPYRPSLGKEPMAERLLEQLAGTPVGKMVTFVLILAIEELLDVCNRATMKDERVHPTSRQIARIHALEEARHVSFARTYLSELWPTLSAEEKAAAANFTRVAVAAVTGLVVNSDVYEAMGIEDGFELARGNPLHRERVTRDLGRLTGFLTELGVISEADRPLWEEMGLLAAA